MKKTLFTALLGMVILGFSSSIMAKCGSCAGLCVAGECIINASEEGKYGDTCEKLKARYEKKCQNKDAQ